MAPDPPASLADITYLKRVLLARLIHGTAQARTETDCHLRTSYESDTVQAFSEQLVHKAVITGVNVFEDARDVAAKNLADLQAQVQSERSQLQLLASLLKLAENVSERTYLPDHLSEGSLTLQRDKLHQAAAKLRHLDALQTEARQILKDFSPSKENRRWGNIDSSTQSLESRLNSARASSPLAARSSTPAATSTSSDIGGTSGSREAATSSSPTFPRQHSPAGWRTAFGLIDPVEDLHLLSRVDDFLREHGHRPADPPSGSLPFVGREGLLGDWLAADAYAFQCMMKGQEHPKEGSSGLCLVEAPAGQGKTRAEQEYSRFGRTTPPGTLAEFLKTISPGLDDTLLAKFVRLWQSENNLFLYVDYLSPESRVSAKEMAHSSPAASEGLRLLAAYTRMSVQSVMDHLAGAAVKLSVGTVMLAVKKHYCMLKQIDTDDILIVNVVRDEAQDMVNVPNKVAAQTYANEMIMSTLAYRCSSLTSQTSMAFRHKVLLYNIAVGTLLNDLKPPSSSQYLYTFRTLEPLLQSDANEALNLYIRSATKTDKVWEASLREDADLIFKQPIVKNMIAETSGVGRFLAFLGESLGAEDGYRRLRREERNWLLYSCLVANDFVLRADQWLTTDLVDRLGGVEVVHVLLDLVFSGVAIQLNSHVGRVAADGRTPVGASFTVRDAMRTGVLYFKRVRNGDSIKLIAPAILLVKLVARSCFSIPADLIQFPALGPVSPARFEEAVALREAAFARMVWRYHDGLVSLRTSYGPDAILSPDLEQVKMRILHSKPEVAREARPFLPQPDATRRSFPVAPVQETVMIEPRGAVNVFDGSKILLCDPSDGPQCPNSDVRFARGEEVGDRKMLAIKQIKRYLTSKGDVSKAEVESWTAQLDIQLSDYAGRYTLIYVYVISSTLRDDAREWVSGQARGQNHPRNLVVVDSKGLGNYLPLIGHRSELLKNV